MGDRLPETRTRVSLTAASAALLLFFAMPLPAQSQSNIQCDALIGFNGVIREGSYAPVIVSVQNSGPRLSVSVTLDVEGGSSFRSSLAKRSMTRTADIPTAATRRIAFVILMPRDARSLTASVVEEGRVVARQDVDLRPLVTTDLIIAAVSSDASLDALTGLSDATAVTRVTYPRIDDLPDSWAGYDGVRAVVVHDTYFRELRETQIEALQRWVVAGGSLVFTGGAAALQHEPAGLAGLLPVHVTGLAERDVLHSLAEIAGMPRGPSGRAVLAVSSLTSGAVVASDDGVPLIVRRDLGKGRIWFLAFDPTLPPFLSWDGVLPLWRLVIGAGADSVASENFTALADDPWMKPLLASRNFPAPFGVALFAGTYALLLLALVMGKFAARIGVKRRILFLAIIPIVACLGAWLLFNRIQFQPGPQPLDASRLWMRSGDGLALVTEKTAVVAASAGTARFAAGCVDCTVDLAPRARGTGQSSPIELSTTTDEHSTVGTVALERFSGSMLVFGGVIPCAVSARVTGNGRSFGVRVTNDTAALLRDCFFWRNGKAFPLGDIPAGASSERVSTPDDLVPVLASNPIPGLKGNPARGALFATEAANLESNRGLLVAWMDGSPLRVSVGGSPARSPRAAVTLLLVEATSE